MKISRILDNTREKFSKCTSNAIIIIIITSGFHRGVDPVGSCGDTAPENTSEYVLTP